MVNIEADNNWVQLTTERFTIFSRLIEGRYPNYNTVIPKNNSNTLTMNRKNLKETLKRLIPFADYKSKLMKIFIQQNQVCFETDNFDYSMTAKEKMIADYNGIDMQIGFNSCALLGILDNIKSSEVQMLLSDPSRAVLIQPSEQPEQEEILMLIMPMILSD